MTLASSWTSGFYVGSMRIDSDDLIDAAGVAKVKQLHYRAPACPRKRQEIMVARPVKTSGVLAECAGDVRAALRLADLGVAEDLLDDPDVDALPQQERRGCAGRRGRGPVGRSLCLGGPAGRPSRLWSRSECR
jgi:hypothetical protein